MSLHTAYDPEFFRAQGHQLIDTLADYLHNNLQGVDKQVISWREPEDVYEEWRRDEGGDPQAFFRRVLEQSTHTHHPQYMGHQISPPVPITALGGLLADLINNGMGVYEMGMAGTALDRRVCEYLTTAMGWGPSSGGFVTAGGSLGNLTALLAARQAQAGFDAWQEGVYEHQPLAIMVSAQSHYCVSRAAQVMGLGEAGVIKVPVDAHYHMRTDLLEELFAEAELSGRKVFAVVGSACTTATGSFDELPPIADFARRHGLWFHVDAAHGGATVFSDKYRDLVNGIELADSVVMDFHKMMLTPAIATAVLFKEERRSYETFTQKAFYLWDKGQTQEWYNLAKRTFECTKQMFGLKFYLLLRTFGTDLIREFVDTVYDLAKTFAAQIGAHPGFELAVQPDCNIVCFRYCPPGMDAEALNELNQHIRNELLREGHFYLVQTRLGDTLWLRVSLMNPFTSAKMLETLLDEAERHAKLRLAQD
ncbi:MAG: pyridoxal-dependent decarboxylase [Bacteroidetes bacterium]|nr:MAG: pyridoxal-dependent decarboxylase [Bacteroidota bacterium]